MIYPARLLVILMFALFAMAATGVHAEEENAETPESIYVDVDPAFVTNYGGPGRLRYMKVGVSLRVTGPEGEASVNRHMPAIRDAMLNLLAVQTNETIDSAEGKEVLRQQSLKEVAVLLEREDGESLLEDLLFTEFVIHR